ncbi:hypothetical protein BJ138DRAFT_279055 [Hygrophoropsis aurantiaca]|uniref:Uncharacterized protein n=1 Tax=Hygrophoropsis aurantiaca TaxID=72124 RepID=A0ACB8A7N5_9AGAM|nr:hypothetical protein BJ138DRAFT_279055 [Hygrophoropsis aurantiaca]
MAVRFCGACFWLVFGSRIFVSCVLCSVSVRCSMFHVSRWMYVVAPPCLLLRGLGLCSCFKAFSNPDFLRSFY